MLVVRMNKEMLATLRLPELEIEAWALITPQGEVEISLMPRSQWNMSWQTFEQLVEDLNILKVQIKLCVENQSREQMAPPQGWRHGK